MGIFILLISLLTCLPGHAAKAELSTRELAIQDSGSASSECSQSVAEQDSLIHEAEENQFNVRRVVFLGNEHTRDNVLRRRIDLINEGEVFTREKLVKSIKSVSQLKKIIYPVKLGDVVIRLDRSNKEVDMTICFKEKRG